MKGARFPAFHKRKGKQSFQADNGPDTVKVDGKREALRFEGSTRVATVVKDGGRWFVCLHVTIEKLVPVETAGKAMVGVNVGIKTLAVCSDGRTFWARPPGCRSMRWWGACGRDCPRI